MLAVGDTFNPNLTISDIRLQQQKLSPNIIVNAILLNSVLYPFIDTIQ